MASKQKERFDAELRKYGIQSEDELRTIDSATPEVQLAILSYLTELTFACQQATNVILGKEALKVLPRSWFLEQLPVALAPHLAANDEWEYRQIEAFLADLDNRAWTEHLQRCALHHDPNIKAIAEEKMPGVK